MPVRRKRAALGECNPNVLAGEEQTGAAGHRRKRRALSSSQDLGLCCDVVKPLPPLPDTTATHWSQLRPQRLKAHSVVNTEGEEIEVQLPEGYTSVEYIGSGTFGSVVGASTRDGVEVVVKAIHCHDTITTESAIREVHNLVFFTSCAPHESIVRMLDCYFTKGYAFLVLERYADTLYDALTHASASSHEGFPRLASDIRRSVSLQLLSGIRHLHRYGLVHRDLKPSNIVVSADRSRLAIIDMGAMRKPEDAVTQGPPLTPAKECMTDGYASPEALKGLPYSREADNFNAGLILAELVVGEEIFDSNETIMATARHLQLDKPRRDYVQKLLGAYTDVARYEVDLVTSLLAANPSARATSSQALRALCEATGAADAQRNAYFGAVYCEPMYDFEDHASMCVVLKDKIASFRGWCRALEQQ